MSRLLLLFTALLLVGGVAAFSYQRESAPGFVFKTEKVNPVSRLDFPDAKTDFSFAIVSDRTGTHRPNVFAQAVEKLNLMQPQFVVSVGDLIEGGGAGEGHRRSMEGIRLLRGQAADAVLLPCRQSRPKARSRAKGSGTRSSGGTTIASSTATCCF